MSAAPFQDFVEVLSVGTHAANFYLQNGYKLLWVGQLAIVTTQRDGKPYIRRDSVFVVGRTKDVVPVTYVRPPRPTNKTTTLGPGLTGKVEDTSNTDGPT